MQLQNPVERRTSASRMCKENGSFWRNFRHVRSSRQPKKQNWTGSSGAWLAFQITSYRYTNPALVEGLPKAKEPFDKLRINSATQRKTRCCVLQAGAAE